MTQENASKIIPWFATRILSIKNNQSIKQD
jgi:hypothetical protein